MNDKIIQAFMNSRVAQDYDIKTLVSDYDGDSWYDFIHDLKANNGIYQTKQGIDFDEKVVRQILQSELGQGPGRFYEGAKVTDMAKKKIDEGTIGGFTDIPVSQPYRELNDFDKWMNIVESAEEDEELDEGESCDEEEEKDLEEADDGEEETSEEKEKVDESVMGGMQSIAPCQREYADDEFGKWMRIVQEGETGTTNLNECPESLVQGDYSNGYGRQYSVNGNDYFPSGADSNVVTHVSPSGQGDNPMQKAVKDNKKDDISEAFEREKVHKDLVHAYRNFLGEYEKEKKSVNKRLDTLEKGE